MIGEPARAPLELQAMAPAWAFLIPASVEGQARLTILAKVIGCCYKMGARRNMYGTQVIHWVLYGISLPN